MEQYVVLTEHRPDQVLTPIEADPRYGRLLALQQRESSELSARHANERTRLAFKIKRELEET
jgi:hypothetical protein